MPKIIEINQPAPDFHLEDLAGRPFRLGEQRDKKHIVLVLNRGFQ
jgi:hypothetical protein